MDDTHIEEGRSRRTGHLLSGGQRAASSRQGCGLLDNALKTIVNQDAFILDLACRPVAGGPCLVLQRPAASGARRPAAGGICSSGTQRCHSGRHRAAARCEFLGGELRGQGPAAIRCPAGSACRGWPKWWATACQRQEAHGLQGTAVQGSRAWAGTHAHRAGSAAHNLLSPTAAGPPPRAAAAVCVPRRTRLRRRPHGHIGSKTPRSWRLRPPTSCGGGAERLLAALLHALVHHERGRDVRLLCGAGNSSWV